MSGLWLNLVVYQFQGSGLRGTIRDGGILCSCTSCNGCRVSFGCYSTLF
jgi:hypothetical protein